MLAAIVGGVALLAVFPFVEMRAAEAAVLPPELLRDSVYRAASAHRLRGRQVPRCSGR